MIWFIGFLTAVLIIDSLFLILLVLVQLPKKEAGMGQAFGGGATDALFGAGSGNVLTKLTKWTAGIFFVLTFSISILYIHHSHGRSAFEKKFEEAGTPVVPVQNPAVVPTNAVSTVSNILLLSATNAVIPATNSPVSTPGTAK